MWVASLKNTPRALQERSKSNPRCLQEPSDSIQEPQDGSNLLSRGPRPDFAAILAPRRARGTSTIIEILRTVLKCCGFAILSSSRLSKSIWDLLGPPLSDLWAPIWTPRAPNASPRWLQDRPRRLQDGSDGFQNRAKGPRGPLQEASKSPRPSKRRPRGAQEPSKSHPRAPPGP